MRNFNPALVVNLLLKVALLVCFAIVFVYDFEHLQGKGMEFMAPFFLAVLFVFPLLKYIKKWDFYPHWADVFITIPFLLDTLGNLFGLFDTVRFFDDWLHAVNWIFVILAVQSFRYKLSGGRVLGLNRFDDFVYGVSVGAFLIVFWEVAEWVVSVDGFGYVSGLHLNYSDTITDLAMSTAGGVAGSLLAVIFLAHKTEQR